MSDRPAARYLNLLSWHDAEVAIRLKLQPTLSAARLAPLWQAIDISVRVLFASCAQHADDAGPCSHTEHQHTLMWLGGRVLTNGLAAVRLLLGGYYGPSVALTRDSVETTMLLALFEVAPAELGVWRSMTDSRTRWRHYNPSMVKKKLTKLGAFHRYEEYDLYTGLAGHPAPTSSRLAFSETWERRMVGPFADAQNAENTLHAVALSTAHGAFQTADVLKVSERFEPDLKALMDALHAWSHPERDGGNEAAEMDPRGTT